MVKKNKEINRMVLVLTKETGYLGKFVDMIDSIWNGEGKICYVCISKPYMDTMNDLEELGINTSNLFFVDVLTSYYSSPEPRENCFFIDGPNNLQGIKDAVKRAIREKDCKTVVFDTISKMMLYQKRSSLVKFTYEVLSENGNVVTHKLFIAPRNTEISEEDYNLLVSDLSMFADKTVEFS